MVKETLRMALLLGSCRIAIQQSTHLNDEIISFVHSTKQMIQFIRYCRGELILESPFNTLCFHVPLILQQNGIQYTVNYNTEYTTLFNNSKVVIIEVCGRKIYEYKGIYLQELAVDTKYPHHKHTPLDILKDINIYYQTEEEICEDFTIILDMLKDKKIFIVPHINVCNLPRRTELIHMIKKISKEFQVEYIDPCDFFKMEFLDSVIEDDLIHYKEDSLKKWKNYLSYRVMPYI